jgi:hypothetical protein
VRFYEKVVTVKADVAALLTAMTRGNAGKVCSRSKFWLESWTLTRAPFRWHYPPRPCAAAPPVRL